MTHHDDNHHNQAHENVSRVHHHHHRLDQPDHVHHHGHDQAHENGSRVHVAEPRHATTAITEEAIAVMEKHKVVLVIVMSRMRTTRINMLKMMISTMMTLKMMKSMMMILSTFIKDDGIDNDDKNDYDVIHFVGLKWPA